MDIFVNGQKISLTQKNFVAKGGEGSIFKREKIAYKVYEDLNKMVPLEKLKELKSLVHPSIVRPIDVFFNEKKHPIGFTMDWVGDDNAALCKLFTNTFREANNINDAMTLALVENIKKTTHFIHEHDCLIVDGNELNYLVAPDWTTPYFIDTNCWQTKNFPASAIMPSIRDWTTDTFTPLTDWFSFAIVTFQLFTGIHPFKGKHKDFRMNDFRGRIMRNMSVFNPQVSFPQNVRDFNLIPGSYKDWYYHLFENGKRTPPPMLPGEAGKVQVKVILIKSTNNFEISEVKEYDSDILYHNGLSEITKTKNKIWIRKTDYTTEPGEELLLASSYQVPILVKILNKSLSLKTLDNAYKMKDMNLHCTDKMIIDNTLYIRNEEKLIQLDFTVMGVNIIPTVKTVWTIEPLSSQLFSNMVVQSVLGRTYFAIPNPSKGTFHIVAIPDLDKYKIIDAKYENQVCVLMLNHNGVYSRCVIKFNDEFNKYKIRMDDNLDYESINFICLAQGVCILIYADTVEIFFNKFDKDDVKKVSDPQVDSSMRLCKDGTKVRFFQGKKLYDFTMKK
jgi:serine/threonine protein kinase